MGDLAKFAAATIRDKAIEELLEENRRLREENDKLRDQASAVSELKDAFCSLQPFVAVTGPGGSPLYSTGVDMFGPHNRMRPIDLHHYDNGEFCRAIEELFDVELRYMGCQHEFERPRTSTYRVSKADRMVCTNVRRDFNQSGSDLIDLKISFAHIHLIVMFHVSPTETRRWTDLDIQNVAEHSELLQDLCDCQLVEDEDVFFACVKFDVDAQGNGGGGHI